MDSDKGPVVFPFLTLGEVFHVKTLSVFFLLSPWQIIFLAAFH